MSGEHYESLSPHDKDLYFAEFMVDCAKNKKTKANVGLQNLIHLDFYYQNFEHGLDSKTPTEDERVLTNMDHWNLCRFSHYVLQCVRGLATSGTVLQAS